MSPLLAAPRLVKPKQYWFTGTVLEPAHDGDTVKLHLVPDPVSVDVGFGVTVKAGAELVKTCRLMQSPVMGCNAIELKNPGGPEARDHLRAILASAPSLRVLSVKGDKWRDRFDGVIYLPDGSSAGDLMVASGYAIPWDGKGDPPTPPWPIPTP